MISFENIDKHDWLYALYLQYLNFAHNRVYYRNFYIINEENIPPKGEATIVIANHQNGLMDALAILHTLGRDGRQPVFIARGDIFKNPFLARIFRFLKIMPTFRSRDGDRSDVRSNLALYERAARVLKNGGTVVIFPEATHQHGHYMNTFKKGFCRIAFAAEELNDFHLGVKVLPLNIHYSNYFDFQSDLMVTAGPAFTYEEFFDNEIEALTHMMSEPYLRRKKLKPHYLPNEKDAAMTIIANLRHFKDEQEPAFNTLMEQTREYLSLLRTHGLHHWVINRKLSIFRLVLRILSMVLSLPLFLFGYINNFVPTHITKFFTNKMKDPMLHSSVQYVVGTIAAFPVWYLLLLALVWIISKHFWIAIAYVALTGLSAFFVHYYKLACQKLLTVVRATRLRHTAAYNTMSSLHKVITGTMERIIY